MILPGLQIASPLVVPAAANFRPDSWPPADDFPVVVDAKGRVVSRYADGVWDLTPWSGIKATINFGDGPTNGARVSPENASLFRMATAWLLWGPSAVQNPSTLEAKHGLLKHVFVTCTEAGVLASSLWRYPRVVERLASRLPRSSAFSAFAVLNDLLAARDALGFVILDGPGLSLLGGMLPERNSTQTAYIPPRIWSYQTARLRECIDDYLNHRGAIEDCYRFCLDAYSKNAGGSLARAFEGLGQPRNPFDPGNARKHIAGCAFHGAFRNTSTRFGIDELLDRWCNASAANGIKVLSNYLTLISYAGLAYVLTFSLMRVDEGSKLLANCLQFERDQTGDDICLLRGATTKSVRDNAALWIVPPSVSSAIEAMASVARMRMLAATHNPKLEVGKQQRVNPLLQARPHEPWATSKMRVARKRLLPYAQVISSWPKLFCVKKLRITDEDLKLAHMMTLGLDPSRFSVGMVWPASWHQLRRTGAVNMLASGLVTDASLQYQLKHANRAMSRYYGQNYYKLGGRFDDETKGHYLREMYASLGREFEALRGDHFVSPYGDDRKEQILSIVSSRDHNDLMTAAQSGQLSYRQTFLGGCAKPGTPCDLGGISNVSGCMGYGRGKPCEWALVDRSRRPLIEDLRQIFASQLTDVTEAGLLRDALEAQLESTERALDVIEGRQ